MEPGTNPGTELGRFSSRLRRSAAHTSSRRIRVVICDDHRLLAEALGAAITRAGHQVDAVVWTSTQALAAVERHHPEVLLLDLRFPDCDGLELAGEVLARHPRTRTVVLTGSDSVDSLRRGLEIGVAGYLRKDGRVDELVDALQRCLRGEQVVDERLRRRLGLSGRVPEPRRPVVCAFTPREHAVAELLREGLNTAQIVDRLGIGESTVRTHVQAILGKLSAHSRVEAVALMCGSARVETHDARMVALP